MVLWFCVHTSVYGRISRHRQHLERVDIQQLKKSCESSRFFYPGKRSHRAMFPRCAACLPSESVMTIGRDVVIMRYIGRDSDAASNLNRRVFRACLPAVIRHYTILVKQTGATIKRSAHNRKLTKEMVAQGMIRLAALGRRITTKALFAEVGGHGSFSTLLKLRKQVEAENPALIENLGVSRHEVVEFIERCARKDLPAIEKALAERRWRVSVFRGYILLVLRDDRDGWAVLKRLGARVPIDVEGWVLKPTEANFDRALKEGFTCSVQDATRQEIRRLERLALQENGRLSPEW